MSQIETAVVICGAGPAGLVLAHLLGREGIPTMVIERLDATVGEPRAIAIDGESLRTLQHVGLLEGFYDELLPGLTAEYVNGEGALLFALDGSGGPFGHPTLNAFDQPALDAYLAASLRSLASVELRFGHTLERFEQSADGVTVLVTGAAGERLVISAKFLVGCDGGRSTVRKQLGIDMQGDSNPLPWLVIDTVDPHLDGTMDCRFFCDAARPGMTLRKRHGERRWEWMLMPGEKPEQLLEEAIIRSIIAPYTDVAAVDIYRKRVYNFHAIVAERWQAGRVFLAGDAAHMTPPFAGQGLNSGFRDVRNLAWKLAGVVRGDYDVQILASYEEERLEHARALIDTALALGTQIQPIDPDRAAERDAFFAGLQSDPAGMAGFQRDLMRSVAERYIDRGLVIEPGRNALNGRMLIQPRMNSAERRDVLLDEALGSGFTLLGYDCDPARVVDDVDLAWWRAGGLRLLPVRSRGNSARGEWWEDAAGELGEWLGTGEETLLLVRPDRFCMAAFVPGDAARVLREARAILA